MEHLYDILIIVTVVRLHSATYVAERKVTIRAVTFGEAEVESGLCFPFICR